MKMATFQVKLNTFLSAKENTKSSYAIFKQSLLDSVVKVTEQGHDFLLNGFLQGL